MALAGARRHAANVAGFHGRAYVLDEHHETVEAPVPFDDCSANTAAADDVAVENVAYSAPQSAPAVAAANTVVSSTTTSPMPVSSGASQPLAVTTDKADYQPGSTATFTVTGMVGGASATFSLVDDAASPGLNGVLDTYAPFTVSDGGAGDLDGVANGVVVAAWTVPSDGSATGATLHLTVDSGAATAATTFTDAPNRIALENLKAGTAESYWNAARSNQIEGFTTDFSVNAGQAINFKINVNGTASATLPYKIEIFRLGYYGGDGATLVTTINNADGTVQPNPLYDAALAMKDAGNWAVTDTWNVPTTAVSGVYLARLQRVDTNGNAINGSTNQIPFIIRNDGVSSDIVLQTSDTTWQAYNGWWGNNGQVGANFYGDASGTVSHPSVPSPGLGAQNRAYALSYNRPIITDLGTSPASGGRDYLFGADYAAIYWLEQNGYNVSYMSGVDADRLGTSWFQSSPGNLLTKAYISVGHDEYWSGAQRANVEAARDAGVNLLFWSGNEVYWKTRYQASLDSSSTSYRTLVSYKETWANGDPTAAPSDYANIDPSNEWTGTWRDLRFVNSVNGSGVNTAVGARPENSLTGQLFVADGNGDFGGALDIPASYTGLRYWRGTAVANSNGTFDIAPGLLGYEWNTSPVDQYRPAGLIKLSETTLPWNAILTDQGNRTSPGTATHTLSLYRDDSGALVFGSGTVFWTWALSDKHAGDPYNANIENLALQQFQVNLLADMGIQPQTLKATLALASASNDHVASTVTMQSVPTQVAANEPITLSGTATDNDNNASTTDGLVALVEVSVDGGTTWNVAQGTTNWTYQWTPSQTGLATIRVRAIDDSLNLPAVGSMATATVNVTPPTSLGLFTSIPNPQGALTNDNSSVELGLKFQALQAGTITALSYYRASGDAADTDVREGHLWTSSGTLLGTVTFNSAPNNVGWQVAQLLTPVTIAANTTYVVSYHTNDNYFSKSGFFDTAYTDPYGMLTSPASPYSNSAGPDGNGLYVYGSGALFPTQSYHNEVYWVDVRFSPLSASTVSDANAAANTVTENAAAGTLAGITAFDSSSSNATYALSNNPGNAFAINPTTGVVTVAGAIDREAMGASVTIGVTATSGSETHFGNFTIGIADVDEFDVTVPVDANAASNGVTVGSVAGATVGITVQASDGDATTNTVAYSLTDNAGGRFAIDAATGIVTVASGASFTSGSTYQIVAKATSADSSVASQTFQIPVAAQPTTITLFDPNAAVSGTLFNDNASVELGMKFQASQNGTISALEYYRAAADANDTDVRSGHLWDANGNLLATVTFTSGVGASGWQTAALTTPISIVANATYTVSYHTEDNYLSTANFFTTGYNGVFGTLSAPSGSNGVYSYSSAPSFPTGSYQSSNYWVDVVFSPQAVVPITVALALDSGTSGDLITNGAALTGTSAPGATISFTIDGVPLSSGATADGVTGAWTFTPSGLADGAHNVVATATNANGSGTASLAFSLDSVAPTVAFTSTGGTVVSASVTVQGTGEVGSTVSLFEGAAQIGSSVVVGAGGTWSIPVTLASVGAHVISARITDVAGNLATSAGSVTYTYQPATNSPPVLAGGDTAAVSLAENTTQAMTIVATDPDAGQTLSYSVAGGVDGSLFEIRNGNVLHFKAAPDFETPLDSGANNIYDVVVQVSDGAGGIDTQSVAVTVTNVAGITLTANTATITGTVEADTLTGQTAANSISGLGGNDVLNGGGATIRSLAGRVTTRSRGPGEPILQCLREP